MIRRKRKAGTHKILVCLFLPSGVSESCQLRQPVATGLAITDNGHNDTPASP
jgi:hypothetical protein